MGSDDGEGCLALLILFGIFVPGCYEGCSRRIIPSDKVVEEGFCSTFRYNGGM